MGFIFSVCSIMTLFEKFYAFQVHFLYLKESCNKLFFSFRTLSFSLDNATIVGWVTTNFKSKIKTVFLIKKCFEKHGK